MRFQNLRQSNSLGRLDYFPVRIRQTQAHHPDDPTLKRTNHSRATWFYLKNIVRNFHAQHLLLMSPILKAPDKRVQPRDRGDHGQWAREEQIRTALQHMARSII